MFVDPKFHFLEENVFITSLNTTVARDHVPEVESQIQVIKEWMWAHHANLPFPSFTIWMTIELANHVLILLNAFPPKSGISNTYCPRTIITGKAIDWEKIFKLHFGAYT